MGLCRYRKGYVNGDLERIEVQHAFLKAAAEQFIRLGNIPNVGNVTRLLADSMDTNLSAANLAYFIRQTLMCSPENINFYTAPNTPREVHALSYTFLDLYDWLELVNTTINPYTTPVTEGQLDLVYLHNGAACCTSVLNGAYYYQLDKQEAVPVQISATEEECQAEAETPANPELLPPPQPSPTMAPGYTPGDDDWLSFD